MSKNAVPGKEYKLQRLQDVTSRPLPRLKTGLFDDALGGGLTNCVVLIGGVPGAGKTTLLLQLMGMWQRELGIEGIFLSTEQSKEHVREFARRVDALQIFAASDHDGDDLFAALEHGEGKIITVDSLQGMGKRFDLQDLVNAIIAMKRTAPCFLVNHMTKDELLAGDLTIQHMVDVTCGIYLGDEDEGEGARRFTCLKNRFGPSFREETIEIGKHGFSKPKPKPAKPSRTASKNARDTGRGNRG